MREKNLRRLMIAGLVAPLTGFVAPGWAKANPPVAETGEQLGNYP